MIAPVRNDRDGLYQRGQVWWMSYRVGTRRIRQSTGYADRKAAELVLAKVKVEIKEDKWFDKAVEPVTPLSQAIDDFMTLYSKPRKASWKDDQHMLNRFQAFVGKSATLQQIDRLTVERFLRKVLAKPVTPARVNRYIAGLKSFWYRQIEWEKVTHNPFKGIKLFPETLKNEYLEVEQVQALLRACSDRLRPIVQVGVLTGLRRGDVLGLRWDSIDFTRRTMTLTQGKTKRSLTLHIGDALDAVLRSIPRFAGCAFVFNENGEPLSRFGWIRTDYEAAWRAAGLSPGRCRFHTLRHTVATQLRFLGKDLALIKEQLGHKSLRMTLRYAHLAPEELRQAANDLGQKLIEKPQNRDSLVTFWSHSPVSTVLAAKAPLQNTPILRPVSESCGTQPEGDMSQTVNASEVRREDPESDALRRAEDDWG